VNVVSIGWKPPPYGWVKLKTYGSHKEGGIAGCGGLLEIAKENGSCVGMCSAFTTKLWGVFEGL